MGNTSEVLRKGLAYGGIGFGAFAIAAPSAFVKTYGLTGTPTTSVFVRLFGTHSLAMGALGLTQPEGSTRRHLFLVNTAMNTLDTILIASAKSTPPKARAAGALTTAAFAGVAGYLTSQTKS